MRLSDAPIDSTQPAAQENVSLSDEQLMLLAVDDAWAFGVLYDRYYESILNYAFRCTLSIATAEDVTSSAFARALASRRRFRPTGTYKSWLYKIATNEIRMHWRGRRRSPERQWPAGDLQRIEFHHDPLMDAAEREEKLSQFALLHTAMAELSDKYRSAIALRYLQGLSNNDIAQVLGKRPGTIKSLISRGLSTLRARVCGKGDPQ